MLELARNNIWARIWNELDCFAYKYQAWVKIIQIDWKQSSKIIAVSKKGGFEILFELCWKMFDLQLWLVTSHRIILTPFGKSMSHHHRCRDKQTHHTDTESKRLELFIMFQRSIENFQILFLCIFCHTNLASNNRRKRIKFFFMGCNVLSVFTNSRIFFDLFYFFA